MMVELGWLRGAWNTLGGGMIGGIIDLEKIMTDKLSWMMYGVCRKLAILLKFGQRPREMSSEKKCLLVISLQSPFLKVLRIGAWECSLVGRVLD